MPAASLRDALIRAYTIDMARCHGCVAVAEILFRRVTFTITGQPGNHNTPGAVLIDSGDALGPIANGVTRGNRFLVMVAETDELLWLPTRADLGVGDYWTIEMVPWVEYLRNAVDPDHEIIRKAHQP
ncbi:hypothetical protein ACQ856_18275 [Mycolicibacterium psychrotolerans]|uniref:hypothetical protein n=1 Tax=Mycolicibacterium psychrotolerans TaxID=216929 RepID=UPI003D670EFD